MISVLTIRWLKIVCAVVRLSKALKANPRMVSVAQQ